jgi:hypothetical protein
MFESYSAQSYFSKPIISSIFPHRLPAHRSRHVRTLFVPLDEFGELLWILAHRLEIAQHFCDIALSQFPVVVMTAPVYKSRLNRAFNRVRIISDNESMKGWQTSKEQKFHHSVYVVLLDDAVAKHPSILRVNPTRDPLKPCVYVGMTGLPVDHRFENHKNGYKSAWVVRKYGVRLMPELYEHLNPMPFEAASQMEMELAEDLRAEGYTVTGGR